jgi:ribosomal protein L3 glutamine methyltransferase
MALQWPQSKVDLLDVSEEALSLAESNIELHGLQGRVRTIKSDLFDSLTGRYDLIVANPPYVSREEYDDLPAEFTHEPELGLVSAEEGLQIPLQILREAVDYLTDSGLLVMEVGYSHEALAQRLQGVPLLWLEFEHGGDGVLALSAAQLQQYREQFN